MCVYSLKPKLMALKILNFVHRFHITVSFGYNWATISGIFQFFIGDCQFKGKLTAEYLISDMFVVNQQIIKI